MSKTKKASAPLAARVRRAFADVLRRDGFVSPVKLFMEMGSLSRQHHEDWRAGRIDYLEKVLQGSLPRQLRVLHELASIGRAMGLKASVTAYKHRSRTLRFSKTGAPSIEVRYSTHYVSKKLTDGGSALVAASAGAIVLKG